MAEYNFSTGSTNPWTITHSLNSESVAVDVMISDGPNSPDIDKISVAVTHTSDNQLTVTFSENHAGFARVVA